MLWKERRKSFNPFLRSASKTWVTAHFLTLPCGNRGFYFAKQLCSVASFDTRSDSLLRENQAKELKEKPKQVKSDTGDVPRSTSGKKVLLSTFVNHMYNSGASVTSHSGFIITAAYFFFKI